MTENEARRVAMVDTQVRPSDVTKFPIIQAMLAIPREIFVPPDKRDAAYMGAHISLGDDRVVLDPRCFAKMIDALNLRSDELVLDLGCGLGYSTAVLAHIAEAVIAFEDDTHRAEEAIEALTQISVDNAAVLTKPLTEDPAPHGPYDAIIIQGGVETVPASITDSLKNGGRIVAIFVENALGTVRLGTKSANGLMWRDVFNANAPILNDFRLEKTFAL